MEEFEELSLFSVDNRSRSRESNRAYCQSDTVCPPRSPLLP